MMDVGGRRRTCVRVLGEERLDDTNERLGDPSRQHPQIGRSVIDDPHPDGEEVLTLERPHAGDGLEEDDAEGEKVGARIDAPRILHLLGCHVEGRPEHGLRRRTLETVAHTNEPEVEELRVLDATAGQEHVSWTKIAMDCTERVRMSERRGETEPEDPDRLPREWPLTQALLEVLTVEPLHREVHPVRGLAVADVANDTWMSEPGERLDFAPEARAPAGIGHVLERDDLSRPNVDGAVHRTRGSTSDLALDPIRPCVCEASAALGDRHPLRVHRAAGLVALHLGELSDELPTRVARLDVALDARPGRGRKPPVQELEGAVLVEAMRHDGLSEA